MNRFEKMTQIVDICFDEVEKLFNMETLETMQMVSIVGSAGSQDNCELYQKNCGCNVDYLQTK